MGIRPELGGTTNARPLLGCLEQGCSNASPSVARFDPPALEVADRRGCAARCSVPHRHFGEADQPSVEISDHHAGATGAPLTHLCSEFRSLVVRREPVTHVEPRFDVGLVKWSNLHGKRHYAIACVYDTDKHGSRHERHRPRRRFPSFVSTTLTIMVLDTNEVQRRTSSMAS